jgi:hypothetical protein
MDLITAFSSVFGTSTTFVSSVTVVVELSFVSLSVLLPQEERKIEIATMAIKLVVKICFIFYEFNLVLLVWLFGIAPLFWNAGLHCKI